MCHGRIQFFQLGFHLSVGRQKKDNLDYVLASQEISAGWVEVWVLMKSAMVFRISLLVSMVAHVFSAINGNAAPSAAWFGVENPDPCSQMAEGEWQTAWFFGHVLWSRNRKVL